MNNRWTFENARLSFEHAGSVPGFHLIPSIVESVCCGIIKDEPGKLRWRAEWNFPTTIGTRGVCSGNKSVYGRITIYAPKCLPFGIDLCATIVTEIRKIVKGTIPDIEVVKDGA